MIDIGHQLEPNRFPRGGVPVLLLQFADGEGNFWLEPSVQLARNHGLSGAQLRRVQSIVEAHHGQLIAAWNNHFS